MTCRRGLLHDDVLVGVRRDLRQVRDDEHLGVAGEPGEAARPRQPPCRPLPRRPRRRRRSGPGWCRPARPPGRAYRRARRPRRPRLSGSAPVLAAISTSSTPEAVKRSQRSSTRSGSRPPSAGPASRTGGRRSEPGVRHRQQGELGRHLVGQPGGTAAPGRGGGRPRRRAGDAGLLFRAQLGDPLVGVVEVEQPVRRLLGPGEHLVDGVAVLPGQRGERCPPLRDGGQAVRVGLHLGGVRRDVGGTPDSR